MSKEATIDKKRYARKPDRRKRIRNRTLYQRAWRKRNPESVQKSQKKYAESSREVKAARQKLWLALNKQKRMAHKMVYVAVRKGLLVKPESCSKCSAKGKIYGHHEDYNKPLDVIWVCSSCHMLIHEGVLAA